MTRSSLLSTIALTSLLALSSLAQAATGFTFKELRIKKTTAPSATKISVPFYFKNDTKRVLTIARYDSACSCLSARVAKGKMEYKPGEKGMIVVDFALGSFSGDVVKTVMLWTKDDSADKPSSVMIVDLHIPELIKITPPTLFWEQGEEKKMKVLKIKINHDKPLQLSNFSGTNGNFPYELKVIKPGFEYELHVTPKDVSAPAFGMLRFSTNSTIKRFQSGRAFVCVKRKIKPTTPVKPVPATSPSSN